MNKKIILKLLLINVIFIVLFFNLSNTNVNLIDNYIKYENINYSQSMNTLTINVNKFGHGVLTCSNPSLEETGD